MQTPQPDNQEPKGPNSTPSSPKTTRKRTIWVRFGVPMLAIFLGLALLAVVIIRIASTNGSHVNTQNEPISYVLNLADQHALKSVTINGDDIVALAKNGQQYHALKEG